MVSTDQLSKTIGGVIGAILGFILTFLIVGNTGMVTQINNALTAICNSGWPLASLFNPDGGIIPLVLVAGLIIAGIKGGMAVGDAFGKGKK